GTRRELDHRRPPPARAAPRERRRLHGRRCGLRGAAREGAQPEGAAVGAPGSRERVEGPDGELPDGRAAPGAPGRDRAGAVGPHLRERRSAPLEGGRASTDPLGIFPTVGLLQALLREIELGPGLLKLFVLQMSVGAIVGVAIGVAAVWVINRVNLDAAGLYPVLATAAGLLSYGVAANLGGSGFLA